MKRPRMLLRLCRLARVTQLVLLTKCKQHSPPEQTSLIPKKPDGLSRSSSFYFHTLQLSPVRSRRSLDVLAKKIIVNRFNEMSSAVAGVLLKWIITHVEQYDKKSRCMGT